MSTHFYDLVIWKRWAGFSEVFPKYLNLGLFFLIFHALKIVFATIIANLKAVTISTIFEIKDVKMAAITLRNIPDDLHRKVKRIQLDLEDEGIRKTLEEIYLELIKAGINKKETSTE